MKTVFELLNEEKNIPDCFKIYNNEIEIIKKGNVFCSIKDLVSKRIPNNFKKQH